MVTATGWTACRWTNSPSPIVLVWARRVTDTQTFTVTPADLEILEQGEDRTYVADVGDAEEVAVVLANPDDVCGCQKPGRGVQAAFSYSLMRPSQRGCRMMFAVGNGTAVSGVAGGDGARC